MIEKDALSTLDLPRTESVGQVDLLNGRRELVRRADHELLFDTVTGVRSGPDVGGGHSAPDGGRSESVAVEVPWKRIRAAEGARHILLLVVGRNQIVCLLIITKQ